MIEILENCSNWSTKNSLVAGEEARGLVNETLAVAEKTEWRKWEEREPRNEYWKPIYLKVKERSMRKLKGLRRCGHNSRKIMGVWFPMNQIEENIFILWNSFEVK